MIEMEAYFILLLISLVIFSISAILQKSFRSFQITVIVFIILLIAAESIENFQVLDHTILKNNIDLKPVVEFIAVVFLCISLWVRFYKTLKNRSKPIDNINS